MSKNQLIAPFFFADNTVNGENYLSMRQQFFIPGCGNDTDFDLLYLNKMVLLRTSLNRCTTLSEISFS